jgi:hypothetical protein
MVLQQMNLWSSVLLSDRALVPASSLIKKYYWVQMPLLASGGITLYRGHAILNDLDLNVNAASLVASKHGYRAQLYYVITNCTVTSLLTLKH